MSKKNRILDGQENDRVSFNSSKNSELTNTQPTWTIRRFQKMVQRHPDHTAVIYFGDDLEKKEKPLRLTYHELDQLSNHLAIELASKCHPDDVVAVILAHMHEYLIALLAIWKTGLVFLPLEIVPDELKNKGECHLDSLTCRIKQAKAKVLVTQPSYKSYFSNGISMIEWKALCNPYPTASQPFTSIFRNSNDRAYIYCSSGTTQAPKMILNDFSGLPGRVRDVARMMKLKYTFSFYNPTGDEIRHHPYTIFFYQDQEQWYYSVTDVHRQNILKQVLPEKLKKLILRGCKEYNEPEEDEILDTLFEVKEFKTLTPPALLGYCGPAFDASLLDFLMIICYGGCLYPVTQQQRRDPGVIFKIFKKANEEKSPISAAVLLPGPLQNIYKGDKDKSLESFQTLTALITMGESCNPRTLLPWFQCIEHLDIYNGYGPTETTIAATVTPLSREKFIKNDPTVHLLEELDMHLPLQGVELYYMEYKASAPRSILNQSEIKVLKQDLEVEIIIGGNGVGQYVEPIEGHVEAEQVFRNQRNAHFPTYNLDHNLHTFQETDGKIIEISNLPHSGTQRYYRTGDLATLKPDGRLLFKSRIDHSFKKNGRLILFDPIAEKMREWSFVENVILLAVRNHMVAFFVSNREADEKTFGKQLFDQLKGPIDFEFPSFCFLLHQKEKVNKLKSTMTLEELSKLEHKPKFLIPKDKKDEELGERHQKIAEIWADIIFSDVMSDEKFKNILPSSELIHFFTPQSDFWCSGGDSSSFSIMLNQISTKLINQNDVSVHDFRSEFLENPNIENLTNLVYAYKSIIIESYNDQASAKLIFLLETIQSEIKDKEFITSIQLKKYDQYRFIKISIHCDKINIKCISTQKLLCSILLKKIFLFQNDGLFYLFVSYHFDQKLLELIKEKFSKLPSKKLKILDDLSNLKETQSDPRRSIKEIEKEFEGHLEVLREGEGNCCVILCYPLTGDCPDQYYQLIGRDCFSSNDTIIALKMNRRKLEEEQKLYTIPKKSAYYVNILNSLVPQPESYIMVGWSFGALLMTQMALDLEKQKKVSLLVNIDCPSPSYIVTVPPLDRAKGLTQALSVRPRLTVPLNLIELKEKKQIYSLEDEEFCPQCRRDSFDSIDHYYKQIIQLEEQDFLLKLGELLPPLLSDDKIIRHIFSYLYGKKDFDRLILIFKCAWINWEAYYHFGYHFPILEDKKLNIKYILAIAQNKTRNLNQDPNFKSWKNYFEEFYCKEFNSDHFNIFENKDFVQWLKNIINENRVLPKTTLRSSVPCNPKEYVLDGKFLDEKKIGELKERIEEKTIDSVSLRNHDSLAHEKIIGILAQALKGATLTALNLIHIGLGYQGIEMLTVDFSTRYLNLFAKTPICYLQILNLEGNQLGAKGAKVIADRIFLHFKHLTQLNISNNDFGDEGVKNLVGGLPKSKLRQLELDHNNITQEGTVALAKILSKTSLTLLNLNKNNIRDKGIEALTYYLKQSRITSINVSDQTETICHHKTTLLSQALELNQQRLAKL